MTLLGYVPGTRAWRLRRDMRLCAATAQRVQEIVDGERVSGPIGADVLRHVEACERCCGEATAFRALKDAVHRVGADADPDLVARLEGYAARLCEGES